jgi:predicted dithiol-disulfide oxidoreductase (DUF899 family)
MTLKYHAAPPHRVVGREEWLEARKALLAKERALTHQLDDIAAERRALPWVKIDKGYVFDSPAGPRTLSDLFEGRGQLAVYHFMLGADDTQPCAGCSFIADHIDGARQHFERADLSFAAVSRAPIERIEAVRRRMGWTFAWVSSGSTEFNRDFGVTLDGREGETYNFAPTDDKGEQHGTSVFAKDDDGTVFHTYSTYARGDETMLGAFKMLDLTPKGRNETTTMSWLRRHDEYREAEGAGRQARRA